MELEVARELAGRAHNTQFDRFGRPFLDHVLRVAEHDALQHDAVLVAAALLHDTVEKGSLTWDDLRDAGVSGELLVVLDAMTERPGESDEDYLRRVALVPPAVALKRVDIVDKLTDAYLDGLTPEQVDRVRAGVARRNAILERLLAAHG